MKDREGKRKKINIQIRDGAEDMSGTDGMIMDILEYEGKMRGFSAGERKQGPGWKWRDCVVTLRKNVTRWV